jgi:peptidoglycan/LPS O-acetylase OafA/YrhL
MLVIGVFRKAIGVKFPALLPTTYLGGITAFISCVIVGLIVYRVVEKPITDWTRRVLNPRPILILNGRGEA